VNKQTIKLVTGELAEVLTGRRVGKLFQLSRNEVVIDFRLSDSRYLYINFSPADPRVYLITRRLKDLERSSHSPGAFTLDVRNRTSGGIVTEVRTDEIERVIELVLRAEGELGSVEDRTIVAQLTGRSANLFITDENGTILERARRTEGTGQQVGDVFRPPERTAAPKFTKSKADLAVSKNPEQPSETLDRFYTELTEETRFKELARSALKKTDDEITKRRKLLEKLRSDLKGHGNADSWKRTGDLLLANTSTARREADKVYITDYFDESLREIAIDADRDQPITELADNHYRRYTKARNAEREITNRIQTISSELQTFERKKAIIEKAVVEKDVDALEIFAGRRKTDKTKKPGRKTDRTASSTRSFLSSDGFEILVGKKAKDNDILTFKMARSLDTWMHAADYPGSHVVVRNPNRKEIPSRTLLEAAQLAAFYSQGKSQVKAAVHYTQKKFVNKPKGAAPGLVSLASFKTLLVRPGVPDGIRRSDDPVNV
jgi:predicted ribosome quality control (RQC) complex YloA/Tae2 family protein